MTPDIFQQNRQVFKKALGIVLILILTRIVLTLGDDPLFCTAPSTELLIRTLLFDVLTIVGLALIAITYQESLSRRARFGVIAITTAGLLCYELVRNSCALPFFGS